MSISQTSPFPEDSVEQELLIDELRDDYEIHSQRPTMR